MEDRQQFYTGLVQQYSFLLKKLKKRAFAVASLRLVIFIAVIAFVYLAISSQQFVYVYAILLTLALFLWLVKISGKLEIDRRLNENLLYINENELAILNGQKNKFYNGADEQSSNNYVDDLDVFGEGSLFELINRTSTKQGKQALAGIFKSSLMEPRAIEGQQQAIKTLSLLNNHRQNIMAGALSVSPSETNISGLSQWINEPVALVNSKKWIFLRYALPVINLTALLISLQMGQYYPITFSVIVSWIAIGSISKYTNQQALLLGKKQSLLMSYASILKEFNLINVGEAVLLQQIQHQTKYATNQINKLSQLVNLLDQRLNVLVNILLNSFLLYDLQCLIGLEKWKLANKDQIATWIESVGVIEKLVSLSTYAFNHPENVYPTFSDDLQIEATDLYHPLIPIGENVKNPLNIGKNDRLQLITGSNMSGKTTYLRTVGINTLMAQCGLPVCAASFHFKPVHLYTSIRISDSLQEHTSYFMAELKRLQSIIEHITSMEPALVLIDEILRGTNSEDKYYGSEAFVKKLVNYNVLSLFATHDLKLSELENQFPQTISNYCFESTIEDNELSFDYKILQGVAKNKNASFLMKKMGII